MKNLNGNNIALRTENSLCLFNCSIIAETEKAILIHGCHNGIGLNYGRIMGGWMPKSALTVDQSDTLVNLNVASWFKSKSLYYI